jgi:hypothetical protein
MNVKLTPHAIELLETVRAQRGESVEHILEHALEVLAREGHLSNGAATPTDDERHGVAEMINFVKRNRVHLEGGLTVKDLIHEGHRI